jgi:hypothetical protein
MCAATIVNDRTEFARPLHRDRLLVPSRLPTQEPRQFKLYDAYDGWRLASYRTDIANRERQQMKTISFWAPSLLALQLMLLPAHAAEEMSAEIIAVQVRDQGYACDKALSAERDESFSKPGEAAWILKCDNATYRVRLVPDLAAKIERLD